MKRIIKQIACNFAYSPLGDKFVSSVGLKYIWVHLHVLSVKKKLLDSAKREYENGCTLGTFEDYKQALKKHWVSFSEYTNQYEFYKKNEAERGEYISRLKMAFFYWNFAPGSAKAVFRNKTRFLRTFKKYIDRKWLYAPEAKFKEFKELVSNYDCIIKPCDGKLGKGIFKTYKTSSNKDIQKLYDSCVSDRMLVEQCIESCEELKAFHPQSLNTIRIVTIANKENACVFSGVLRTGVGDSVIDNSHKGGVSAQINVKDGVIETDGANTSGERFVCHPDSHIKFKGFRIPMWDKIVETCCEAAKQTGNPITGWDVVLNNQGKVEFIEANYGPDMDMMQTRYNKGARKLLFSLIKKYCGIDMK